MLQKRAVYPRTFEVLKRLSSLRSFADFSLAGGTALALQYGHRISVDLDFFTHKPFKNEKIIEAIENEFKNETLIFLNVSANSIAMEIDDVKVDILAHQYKLIEEPMLKESIRIYSVKDIGAMKLNAIANRGTKKDFIDVYEILKHYSLKEMLSFFKLKYSTQDVYYIIRALTYFVDADEEMDLILIKNYKWEEVKLYIKQQIAAYSKSL